MCLRETETRLLQRPRLAPVLTTTVAQTSRWHSCAMFVAIKMNKLQQFGGAEPSRHTAIGLLLDKLLSVTGTKVGRVFASALPCVVVYPSLRTSVLRDQCSALALVEHDGLGLKTASEGGAAMRCRRKYFSRTCASS